MRLAKERREPLIMPHKPLGFEGGDEGAEGQDIRELKVARYSFFE